jgi:hypothetical protein
MGEIQHTPVRKLMDTNGSDLDQVSTPGVCFITTPVEGFLEFLTYLKPLPESGGRSGSETDRRCNGFILKWNMLWY